MATKDTLQNFHSNSSRNVTFTTTGPARARRFIKSLPRITASPSTLVPQETPLACFKERKRFDYAAIRVELRVQPRRVQPAFSKVWLHDFVPLRHVGATALGNGRQLGEQREKQHAERQQRRQLSRRKSVQGGADTARCWYGGVASPAPHIHGPNSPLYYLSI